MTKINISKSNFFLSLLALLFIFSFVNPAYSFDVKGEGCTTECIQCHDMNLEEASEILKGLVEKVVSVEEGPLRGMWEVEVQAQGNTFPVYLHYSKKYIIAGNIIDIKTKERVGKTPKPAKPARVDLKNFPLEDAFVIGDPSAENAVIVFDDPDCPFCRKFHPVMKEVISRRKDIAFHIILFPIVQLHPKAYDKAKAIVCEKSLKLLDDAFTGKPLSSPTCETDQIDRNIELAASLGISGTPTLILKDGQIVPGYLEADRLIEVVDSVATDSANGK